MERRPSSPPPGGGLRRVRKRLPRRHAGCLHLPHSERGHARPPGRRGGQEEDRSFPPPPRGTAKPRPTGAHTPPNAGGVKRRPGTCPPPPGGVKRRPAGASSPSPRLHHPGILFRQPGVTSTCTCSSGSKFSLMEAATQQDRPPPRPHGGPRQGAERHHTRQWPSTVPSSKRARPAPGSGTARGSTSNR